MTVYEYNKEQRDYFRDLIAGWQQQNALKTTSDSVKRANLERISKLEYMINLKK